MSPYAMCHVYLFVLVQISCSPGYYIEDTGECFQCLDPKYQPKASQVNK